MREMRTMMFATDLIDDGHLSRERNLRMFVHTADAEDEMGRLAASSKMNADAAFLRSLLEPGARKADEFLERHFDQIGVESSTDVAGKFM